MKDKESGVRVQWLIDSIPSLVLLIIHALVILFLVIFLRLFLWALTVFIVWDSTLVVCVQNIIEQLVGVWQNNLLSEELYPWFIIVLSYPLFYHIMYNIVI